MTRKSANPQPTSLRPPEAPAIAGGLDRARSTGEWRVSAGGRSVVVRGRPDGEASIAIDGRVRLEGSVAAPAVTQWCREASLLMDVALPVEPADELELRTPPLVSDAGCLALLRRSTVADPAFALVLAATPAALSADIMPEQVPMARDEVKQLVAALLDAVSATPRNA